jgi:hypothetical protein
MNVIFIGTTKLSRCGGWEPRRAPAIYPAGRTVAIPYRGILDRVRCRHDEMQRGSILRADGTIQIDVFGDELRSHFRSVAGRSPARPRRFIGPNRASSANMMRSRRPRFAAARRAHLTAREKPFLTAFWAAKIAFGVEWTRHQLTPTMATEEIIKRAVAGLVAGSSTTGVEA